MWSMDQQKIGNLIKQIRKQNHFTQQQFADRYGVTYQAVSKWENGKNMPDISLLKAISDDFDVNIDDILNGEVTPAAHKKNKTYFVLIAILIVLAIVCIIVIVSLNRDPNFEFRTISSNCEQFTISGSIAYNDNKSSIYISNIDYCGALDETKYEKLECILYEKHDNREIQISQYASSGKEKLSLEEFLKQVRFKVDDYEQTCKNYDQDSLYLQINAFHSDDKVTSYKVQLSLDDDCV